MTLHQPSIKLKDKSGAEWEVIGVAYNSLYLPQMIIRNLDSGNIKSLQFFKMFRYPDKDRNILPEFTVISCPLNEMQANLKPFLKHFRMGIFEQLCSGQDQNETPVNIHRGEDGRIWVRPQEDMDGEVDGVKRFTPINLPTCGSLWEYLGCVWHVESANFKRVTLVKMLEHSTLNFPDFIAKCQPVELPEPGSIWCSNGYSVQVSRVADTNKVWFVNQPTESQSLHRWLPIQNFFAQYSRAKTYTVGMYFRHKGSGEIYQIDAIGDFVYLLSPTGGTDSCKVDQFHNYYEPVILPRPGDRWIRRYSVDMTKIVEVKITGGTNNKVSYISSFGAEYTMPMGRFLWEYRQ